MEEEPAENQAAPSRRAINELLRLTRENNRILRADRNMRRVKGLVIIVFLLGSTGYGYHLFSKYRAEAIALIDQINDVRTQVDAVVDEVGQLADTAKGITDVLGGDADE